MRMLKHSLLTLPVLLMGLAVGHAQEAATPEAAPAVTAPAKDSRPVVLEQDPLLDVPRAQSKLAYSLVIDNRRGGIIRIVDPPATFLFNRPGVDLGTVVQPVRRLRTDIPVASLPAPPNVVCYSGSDAIHIKGWNSESYESSAVFSIMPSDNERYLSAEAAAQWDSLPGNFLLTDIPAGQSIFGGAYPLIVGNPVNVYRGQNILDFSPLYPDIEVGDRIVVGVYVPADWPDDLRISNSEGGAVEFNLAGQTINLAGCIVPQGDVRPGSLPGPYPPAGIAATDSTSFAIGVPGGDGREYFGVNAQGYGTAAGMQLVSSTELALPWQPPLFMGYLYPFNPLDPPAKLPLPVIRLRFGSGSSWVPLGSVTEQQALSTVTALRIDWLPVGTEDEGKVITETATELEIGPAK
ncbi:MAG: hypothetical protein H7A35_09680 [Planctomycetales bacterium]|nr:hypothetical protein [bacterium]UNM07148.1 MAG: hypothetical protein H7A35_09680 [Planctomycetales bacterium]